MAIDIALCAVVIILFLLGLKRGFFKSIPKLLRYAVALCLAICLSSSIIDNLTGPYCCSLATLKIEEYIVASCPEITSETATAVLPTALLLLSSLFGITIPVDSTASGEELIHEISLLLGGPVGTVAAMILTYAVLFVVFSLAIKILLKICDSVFSYGALGVINKILGGAMGLAVGCVISCTAANVLAQFFPQYAALGGLPFHFFLNFNPLAFIFSF